MRNRLPIHLAEIRNEIDRKNMYFDELSVGQYGSFAKTVTETDVGFFTAITGDFNPLHVDIVKAQQSQFSSRIVHGMLNASLLCSVYGMQIPGSGAVHLEQTLSFVAPVRIGDTITAHVQITRLAPRNRVHVRSWCTNQNGEIVIEGTALLRASPRPDKPSAGPTPNSAQTEE